MAADEQQAQPFVRDGFGQFENVSHVAHLPQGISGPRLAARLADRIERAALGRDEQPGGDIARRFGERDASGGGIGEGLLRRVQIAQLGGERGHHAGPRRHDRLGQIGLKRHPCIGQTGRTSIPPLGTGMRLAHSSASSRLATSMM